MSDQAGSSAANDAARSRISHVSLDRLAFWLIIVTVATLPLEFTKQFFPVSWLELSRVVMAPAVVVTLLAAARNRDLRLYSPLLAAALVMVATAAISVVVAVSFPLKELSTAIIYFGFAVSVAWATRTSRQLKIVGIALAASAVVVAVVAILEQVTGQYLWRGDILDVLSRRNSTFGDPNIAARMMALGLMSILGLTAASKPRLGRMLVVVAAAALLGAGEALTQSRTVWILTAATLVPWLLFAVWRRRTALPIVAFGIGMAVAVITLQNVATRAQSIAPITGSDDPAAEAQAPLTPLPPGAWMATGNPTPVDGLLRRAPLDDVRRYLIRAGVAVWLDHPVLGVGLGGYDAAMKGPYWQYVPVERRGYPTTLLHTDVIRVLAETGLVGAAGLLVFIGSFLWAGLRLLLEGGWLRAFGMTALTGFGLIFGASQMAGRFGTEPYLWLLVGVVARGAAIASSQRAMLRRGPYGVARVAGVVEPGV